MPWEVTIRRADGAPLGDREAVRGCIASSLPGVRFERQPSGAEQIAAARAVGVEFPDVILRHLEQRPPTEQAFLDAAEFSIRLYGLDSPTLHAVHAEVRGDGNPVPALAALCVPNGWVAVDDASGQPVELEGASAAGWESFRAYRERAIRSIHEPSGG